MQEKVHFSCLPAALVRALSSPPTAALISFLVAAACYLNSLHGDLVHDDIFAVRDNLDIRPETSFSKLLRDDFWGKEMFSETSHKSYRPLTVLTFRVNYALHGLDPWGYHVVNVALHATATALFQLFCSRVVFRCCDLSLLAALVFAVHPVHTEAVTGIVGRADILSCIMFLLAFMSYRTSVLSGQQTTRWPMLCLSLLLGSLSMFFKEHGVTVLGACLAYDLLVASRRNVANLLRSPSHTHISQVTPFFIRTFAVMATLLPLLIFRIKLMRHMPHFSAQDNPASFAEDLSTRFLTYCYLLFFNARLLVAPITLCYDWQMGSIPLVKSLADFRNVETVFFFSYLFGLFFYSFFGKSALKHRKVTVLGLLLLVIPFLPASNLFLRIGFVVAERILYIPSIGYCILLVQGIQTLSLWKRTVQPQTAKARERARKTDLLLLCLVAILVSSFGVRTVVRNRAWQTRESLFRSGLETVPNNAKIHFNYGNFLKDSGRTEEAIEQYRAAISLAPEYAVSHNNLGTLLQLDIKQAEYHFRQAVKYNPQHYRAFFNLGKNLEFQGRITEAEAAFNASIRIKEDYYDAFMGLAMMIADAGRAEEGWAYMQRAAEIVPNNADVINNLGAYLLRLDKKEEAIDAYLRALQLNPGLHTAMTNLARVYRSLGLDDKAEETFKRSLAVKREAITLNYLGALYFNTKRYQQAAAAFKEGLQLEPANVDMACSYGQSLIALGEESQAEEVYLQVAAARPPTAACVHCGLAGIYSKQKSLEKALKHSKQAVELSDPTSVADAYHLHGGILKDLGLLQESEQAYRTAVKLSPRMVASRLNLGAVLHMRGEYAAAEAEYEMALKLDPNNEVLKDNLFRLRRAWKSAT